LELLRYLFLSALKSLGAPSASGSESKAVCAPEDLSRRAATEIVKETFSGKLRQKRT
jgi:hypothetical protein